MYFNQAVSHYQRPSSQFRNVSPFSNGPPSPHPFPHIPTMTPSATLPQDPQVRQQFHSSWQQQPIHPGYTSMPQTQLYYGHQQPISSILYPPRPQVTLGVPGRGLIRGAPPVMSSAGHVLPYQLPSSERMYL